MDGNFDSFKGRCEGMVCSVWCGTDRDPKQAQNECMKQPTPTPARVVSSDQLDGDLIVTFNDGQCALFTASFLHDHLDQAKVIIESDEE